MRRLSMQSTNIFECICNMGWFFKLCYCTRTGADTSRVKRADAGLLLSDTITNLLLNWTSFVPNGLSGVGYGSQHLEALVKGTLPQRKVIDVSPRQPTPDDFHELLTNSMKLF